MKWFVAYNEDYKEITEGIFIPSIKDKCDLIKVKIENFKNKWSVAGGDEGDEMRKNLIEYALRKTNKEEIFVVCDTDIKFYNPVVDLIIKEMSQNQKTIEKDNIKLNKIDFIIQKEKKSHDCNMGFMAMRNNEKVKEFWDNVYKISIQEKKWDQPILNDVLRNNTIEDKELFIYKNNLMNWTRFSDKFWNWSMGASGSEFNNETCLHHANCSVTKENKKNQFDYVEECFKNNQKIDFSKRWM